MRAKEFRKTRTFLTRHRRRLLTETLEDRRLLAVAEPFPQTAPSIGDASSVAAVVAPASIFDIPTCRPVDVVSNTIGVETISFTTQVAGPILSSMTGSSAAVAGVLFDDANSNGIHDVDEPALAGVRVYIDVNGNGSMDATEPNQLSMPDGSYSFTGLAAGETIIAIDGQSGSALTTDFNEIPRLFVNGGQNILEVSPLTGSTLKSFNASTSLTFGAEVSGMAFDGSYLYVVDSFLSSILIVDPNLSGPGIVVVDSIDHSHLPNQNFDGLAIIGSTLYALDGLNDVIVPLDLSTQTFGAAINIAAANSGTTYDPWTFNLTNGLGESADGTQLVASTTTNARVFIDPTSGLVTDVQYGATVNVVGIGLAGTSNRQYVGQASTNAVRVMDAGGIELDQLSVGIFPYNVAAGDSGRLGSLLTLDQSETVTLNFGLRTTGGSIAGIQFVDANANGTFDAGETPLAGATVFIDSNNNAWPDPNELQAISAADGTYTIAGVGGGSHNVRSLSPQHHRPSDAYPTSDRLFAIAPGTNLGGGLYAMRVIEIDPQTGNVIAQHLTSLPISYQTGLAFDGNRLIVIDNNTQQDLVYELTIDGSLIDQAFLGEEASDGSGRLPVEDFGATEIGGSILSVRKIFDQLFITRYDANTNEFVVTTPITVDWGYDELPTTHSPRLPNWFGSTLGRSPDGTSIVIYGGSDSQTFTIDVATGVATPGTSNFIGEPFSINSHYDAYESIGGETFRAEQFGVIEVLDASGANVRNMQLPFFLFGLGGGTFRDNSQTVVLVNETSVDGVNHGATSTLSTVLGNVDGVPAGTFVFNDSNANGVRDAGETETQTGVAGDYVLTDLFPGPQRIAVDAGADKVVQAIGRDQTRLFVYSRDQSVQTITEIDPRSGETIHTFPGPADNNDATGMAMSGGKLYVLQDSSLHIMDPDTGAVLDTIAFPPGFYRGLAIIDSVAYAVEFTSYRLQSFDLITRRTGPTIDLTTLPLNFSGLGGAGEWTDGQSIVIRSNRDAVVINPTTGAIVKTFIDVYPGDALAGAGDEWFDPGIYSNGQLQSIDVRDSLGLLRRRMRSPHTGFVDGFAAGQTLAPEHRMAVYGDDVVTGVDFRVVAATGTIVGTQFIDADENGVFNAGEQPLANVVVFADGNANGWPDAGEPSTISGIDGTYTLNGVPSGNALIRTLMPTNHVSTTVTSATDRLYVASSRFDVASPLANFMDLRELDPQTGAVLSLVQTNVPTRGNASIAYDGSRLIVVENELNALYEVATDGTVLDQTALPWQVEGQWSLGPAVVDGTVYVMTGGTNGPSLYRYDAESNVFDQRKQVTEFQTPFNQVVDYSLSLSESPDGTSILAFGPNGQIYAIEPSTGRATLVPTPSGPFAEQFASTSLGGELFLSGRGSNGIEVYDGNFQLQRVMPIGFNRFGLGGGTHRDHGQVVQVGPGETVSGASFGYRSTLSSISGNVVDEAGSAVVAATVFVDANRNGDFDIGETSTITDGNGNYELIGVPSGDYDIRVDDPWVSIAGGSPTRLFAGRIVPGGDTEIVEIDPITSATLNSFTAPVNGWDVNGLALNDDALFMTTGQGLYSLNPDDGSTLAFLPLPIGDVFSVATVGDHVYVSDQSLDVIYKIDPRTQTIVTTFDLFAIHELTPDGPFDLLRGMSESLDGTALLVEVGDGTRLIDVQTGLASLAFAPSFQWDATAINDELYLNVGNSVHVFNADGIIVRRLPVGGPLVGIGAGDVAGPRWNVSLGRNQDMDMTGRDFTVRVDAAPTDIHLSSNSIHENVDAWFADLSVVDQSPIDSHAYSLIGGGDDDDNDRFRIDDGRLKFVAGETIDYETQSKFRVRLMATDSSGQSVQTAVVIDVLDLVEVESVVINDGHEQRSSLQSVTIRFEGNVQIEPGAFTIARRGTGLPIEFDITANEFTNGFTLVTLHFTGDQIASGSLVDGWYRLEINASSVSSDSELGLDSDRDGSPGDNYLFGELATDKFYRRYGDGNGDGIVNGRDFRLFVSTYGQLPTSSLYRAYFDANGDGIVNGRDFRQFRTRYGVPFLF